jgi:signal transduction histidine kinase
MTGNDIVYTVILSTLVILLLIAGVAITIFMANKQRITQEVKMAEMQRDYEKEMRTVQDEVQEQVLTNISRELHDNIGQLMTFMHIQLEQKKLMNPEMQATLNPIHETLSKATQEVRSLGRSLNSDLLEQNGLLNTINAEVTRLRQFKHFEVSWENDATEPKLTKDQRLMAFRIFQEILNNMLKHAKAAHVAITLAGKEKFALVVKDDGKGFNVPEIMSAGSGSGLRNIVKRATLANLVCTIDSETGKGSIFTLTQSVVQA